MQHTSTKTNFTANVISVDELWGFFNLSNSFLCIIGTDGYLRHVNPSFCKTMGYTEEELLSMLFTDFIHPDDRKASTEKILEVSNRQPLYAYRSRFRTAGGDYRWLSWTAVSSNKDGLIYSTGEDCTERKEIEDEMEKLSLIARKTAHGITITGNDRKIIWVNEAFTHMTGYDFDEVIGKSPLEVLGGPLTSSDSNVFIKSQIEKEQPFFKETINYKKNGEPFWMRVEGQPIFDEKGNLIKWIAIQTNITNQKMAEEAIISNEKKYRSIFDSSPLSNFIYDPHSLQILEVNNAAISHYGYTLGEFLNLTINDLRTENDPYTLQQILNLIKQGIFQGTCRHKKKNGDIIIADVTASLIEYKNRHAVLLIIKDVTEKMKLEELLLEERLNKEKNILQATLQGQEKERTEIGKELHDNVNQMLTTVKLYLDMATSDKKKNNELIKKGTEILLSAINEIRTLSKTLVAPGVIELDLAESINDLIHSIKKGKSIHIKFESGEHDELPGKIRLTLFRIVQEQLNNILKHANAEKVKIQLLNETGNIKLVIRDDGQGFDTGKKKNGIGLNNIISRTALHNGTVNIDSAPGKGCQLTVNIPSDEIFKIAI